MNAACKHRQACSIQVSSNPVNCRKPSEQQRHDEWCHLFCSPWILDILTSATGNCLELWDWNRYLQQSGISSFTLWTYKKKPLSTSPGGKSVWDLLLLRPLEKSRDREVLRWIPSAQLAQQWSGNTHQALGGHSQLQQQSSWAMFPTSCWPVEEGHGMAVGLVPVPKTLRFPLLQWECIHVWLDYFL